MKSIIRRAKVILIPYPAQGHVTPMLKLASVLLSRGLDPVLVIPDFIHIRIFTKVSQKNGISFVSIPDGIEEGRPRDFFSIETAMENHMPSYFERIILKIKEEEEGCEIACVVVDLLASWAIGVARRCGIPVAGFWPAMLATYRLIAAIPEMVHSGVISETGVPVRHGPISLLSQGQPTLTTEDLPWLIGNPSARVSRFRFWIRSLNRSRTLRWLLVNTFSEQEFQHKNQHDNNNLMIAEAPKENFPQILPIGPLNLHTMSKNPSFWEEDLSCLDWLEKQSVGSVVYISFGSWVSPIGEAKIRSIAQALEASHRPFIWVLQSAWREGLPKGYLERVSKQGKIVSWAPQVEVLKHEAVGCYLTHCGWNSTMEAILCKKRLLCYPVAGDQFLNCAFIVEAWRVGVRIGGFGQKDVEEGLKRVMDQDKEMNHRMSRLNERVMGKGASSRAMDNLGSFVSDINKFDN